MNVNQRRSENNGNAVFVFAVSTPFYYFIPVSVVANITAIAVSIDIYQIRHLFTVQNIRMQSSCTTSCI